MYIYLFIIDTVQTSIPLLGSIISTGTYEKHVDIVCMLVLVSTQVQSWIFSGFFYFSNALGSVNLIILEQTLNSIMVTKWVQGTLPVMCANIRAERFIKQTHVIPLM